MDNLSNKDHKTAPQVFKKNIIDVHLNNYHFSYSLLYKNKQKLLILNNIHISRFHSIFSLNNKIIYFIYKTNSFLIPSY
jgi:hypothetical protein